MPSIVWVMLLIVPVALVLRVLVVALTGQKTQGAVRSKERAEREDGVLTVEPENPRDYTSPPSQKF
jgi:hypothetical protein